MWSDVIRPELCSQWLMWLVTGRPTGTNLFVGAVIYLSTLCASQWRWYPEVVESEGWIHGCMDGLFIYQGLKVTAWQCELASDDIPRDVETCSFIYQTSWHVWVFMFDLVDLMHWVGGFSAHNQVFQRWASGKTQQNSFHWLNTEERKTNPETRHLSTFFLCTQFNILCCVYHF